MDFGYYLCYIKLINMKITKIKMALEVIEAMKFLNIPSTNFQSLAKKYSLIVLHTMLGEILSGELELTSL